jgi:hypothetical protein
MIGKTQIIIAAKCLQLTTRYFDFDIASALRLLEPTSQQ